MKLPMGVQKSANVLTGNRGVVPRGGGRPGGDGMKGAVPKRVNATTAEAVLRAIGYRVYRETFDLVAVRSLESGKRFHTRIEAHGEPTVPKGAEIDVHIDYLAERGHGHRPLAHSEGIAIEMELLIDFLRRGEPPPGGGGGGGGPPRGE